MRALGAAILGAWALGAFAAEVTVLRPKSSIIAEEWEYYIVVGGKAVSDLRSGERVTLQVPAETRALVIHCPKTLGGYEESRVDYDFNANPRAFFELTTRSACVNIRPLDAAAAAPLVRATVPRANRRVEYDGGKVATPAASPPTDSAARDQVAAATSAWVDAFNSRDAARMAALYDANAVLTDTGEPSPRSGGAAIGEYYKRAAQKPTERVALGERTIRVFGDTAIDSGTLTYFEMRDGKAVLTPARYSLTYRRQGEKWLIVDHQASLNR